MNEEMLDALLEYIDAKIEDVLSNHRTSDHGQGAYFNHSDEASKVKRKLYDLLLKGE